MTTFPAKQRPTCPKWQVGGLEGPQYGRGWECPSCRASCAASVQTTWTTSRRLRELEPWALVGTTMVCPGKARPCPYVVGSRGLQGLGWGPQAPSPRLQTLALCPHLRLPSGLEDVSKYPDLVAELLRRQWTEEEVRGALAENLLRVFKAVEQVRRDCHAPVPPPPSFSCPQTGS